MLESKAFAVLTIKLVQRKVKVGINKDMYCTVLLNNRKAFDGLFYMPTILPRGCFLFTLDFANLDIPRSSRFGSSTYFSFLSYHHHKFYLILDIFSVLSSSFCL